MKKKPEKETVSIFYDCRRCFYDLMKVVGLLILLSSLSVPSVFANTILQSIKVSIQRKNVSISKVLDDIERQTGYSILVRDNDINTKQKITVDQRDKDLDQVLAAVFGNMGVKYDIVGKTISIYKPNESVQSTTQSQKRVVTGTVYDAEGEPVIGANVLEKADPMNGAITDIDGKFSLKVSDNATLVVSYIGYNTQEISVKGKNVFNITLTNDVKLLEEVVVIGYTTQKKGLLTGSVESMNVTESLEKMATISPANMLAGQLAGVTVSTASGIPGNTPGVSIRTGSSWNSQDVLYVIDGVVRDNADFNNLSPNEIENITVLKDAASAAIYGARSEGGVILITTKRGKLGKPKFNYSYSYGVDSRTKNIDLTSGVELAEIYNRVFEGENAGWAWSQEEIDYIRTVNGGWGYDQLDYAWVTPSVQTHNFNVTGGAEKVKYFAGVSYYDQQGFLRPLSQKKFNFRLNTTVDITDKLQFFASMSLNENKGEYAVWEGAESLYNKLLVWQPDQPVLTNNGQYIDYGWIANVGAELNGESGYSKSYNLRPQINLNVTYQLPIDGLSVKAAYASNWRADRSSLFRTSYQMAQMKMEGAHNHIIHIDDESILGWKQSSTVGKDYIEKTSKWNNDYQLNFQLNYNKTFNQKHSVQAAFVYERSESSSGSVTGGRETFPVYLTDQFWAASDARKDTWASGDPEGKNGRASFIGQVNYSYDNKYLFNFSFREDGSMKFAKDDRWGFFPAGSVGWVISEEAFFNKSKINYLKLRLSAGLTGNDSVGGWAWQEKYEQGNSSYFGLNPSKYVGLRYGRIANTTLTWEKSFSYNVGADTYFLDHWNASLEYWYRNTYDILGDRTASVPTSFSLSMPQENYGEIHAQGIDFSLGYQNTWGEVDFRGKFNMSYGWNEVVIKDHAENAKWYDIPVGRSMNYIKGYRYDRILRTQDELDKFKAENPDYRIDGVSPQLGMMIYKDLSGPDGTPDGIIDSWDIDILKNKNNPINYGLTLGASWKGLSLDMLFSGQLNYKKSFKAVAGGVNHNRMWSEWYDNSWTPDNPNAFLPKRVERDNTYNRDSDFWLKDASNIRLRYLNLGYTIPQHLYGNVLDRVKLFFSANNLFVLSNFKYWDPERGSGTDYPTMRTFNFGIDVTF